jgi:hypothetical protein
VALFIVDDKGFRRELTQAELERVPLREVFRSSQLRGLSVAGVRLLALLDRLLPFAAVGPIAIETADGERLSLSREEAANAVVVYRMGVGALPTQMGGALRLMLVEGGQIASVQRLRGIYVSSAQREAAA